jgi:DNA-binding CsgD family transcriptional regulator
MTYDDDPLETFTTRTPAAPDGSSLPAPVNELLGRLSSELARNPSWLGEETFVYCDPAAGVRVVLEPLRPIASLRRRLSKRELQIATMIAEGHSNKTVGYELGISIWTVSTHLRRIFAKLEVRSRAAMVARLAEPLASSASQRPVEPPRHIQPHSRSTQPSF